MSSPTSRSLEALRKDGWLPAVVEKFNSFSRTRHDLYGFIDILAVREKETLAVQACHYSDVADRVAKIQSHENFVAVVASGWRIEVWGWHKPKTRYVVRKVPVI